MRKKNDANGLKCRCACISKDLRFVANLLFQAVV